MAGEWGVVGMDLGCQWVLGIDFGRRRGWGGGVWHVLGGRNGLWMWTGRRDTGTSGPGTARASRAAQMMEQQNNTHTHTHARARARARAHTHTHTHK